MQVLYLSFDGILEHVVYSQVARPLRRLSRRGLDYTLVTLEKPDHLEQTARLEQAKASMREAGVEWTYRPYQSGGGKWTALGNVRELCSAALEAADRCDPDLVHARSHVSAVAALMLRRLRDLPYIFDFRAYWIDNRLEAGKWFANPLVLQLARGLEVGLFQHAAGLVSLTEVAAGDLRRNRYGKLDSETELEVIPTCVDYDDFEIGLAPADVSEELADRLRDKLVVGHVGSINPRYRIDRGMALFEEIWQRTDEVCFVCLTSQRERMRELLDERAIPERARLIATVDHDEMPQWLQIIDWGLLLAEEAISHRASMPTKLAEFLATGVRPIQYGCNAEVVKWVDETDTGLALSSTSDEALAEAAGEIVASHGESGGDDLRRAREMAREHFSLTSGIDRYERLIHRVGDMPK